MHTPSFLHTPVLITLPGLIRGEALAIVALQRAGAGIIHIRKPGADPARLAALLDELRGAGADFNRLTLHGDEALALRYGFGGLHLKGEQLLRRRTGGTGGAAISASAARSERAGMSSSGGPLRLSCSAHSWEEALRWAPCADYVWLSPLFDSISKAGYRSGLDIGEASMRLLGARAAAVSAAGQAADFGAAAVSIPERIVALGGIAPENIARVRMAGFGGAAVLGALWAVERDAAPASEPGGACACADRTEFPAGDIHINDKVNVNKTLENFGRLDRRWKAAGGTLQLISDGDLTVARAFLEGGGRWLQLRMKEAGPQQITARGREMAALCRPYGAVLLLNDHPALVAEAGAHGVHLGKSDMPPAEARALLGPGAIIGCTANTLEDILALSATPADYVGLGPFRFTTTKKNLSPILGEAGYRRILSALRDEGLCLPVVAIGGIELEDVETVMRSGVNGLALSGAVARSADVQRTTRSFVEAVARWRLPWDEPGSGQSG